MSLDFDINSAMQLFQSQKEFPVNFSDAWVWLRYSRKDVAKKSLLNCGFIENVDYRIEKTYSTGISKIPKEDIFLTFQAFKSFTLLSRKKNSAYILNIISEIDSGNINVTVRTRLEMDFKDLLFACISWKTLIIPQFYCAYGDKKYFVDFYIPEFKLAIEYDEKYHKSQQTKDKLRQKILEALLDCTFIRVKQGEESLAISQICQKVFS